MFLILKKRIVKNKKKRLKLSIEFKKKIKHFSSAASGLLSGVQLNNQGDHFEYRKQR